MQASLLSKGGLCPRRFPSASELSKLVNFRRGWEKGVVAKQEGEEARLLPPPKEKSNFLTVTSTNVGTNG
jgi:hypothetical protein